MGKAARRLRLQPGPVDLLRQNDKLMLHVDDLIQAARKKSS